jgi:hypothetical protein
VADNSNTVLLGGLQEGDEIIIGGGPRDTTQQQNRGPMGGGPRIRGA